MEAFGNDGAPQPSRRPRVEFHVTGFGAFNGVDDNPTMHLVRELPGELAARRSRRAKETGGPPDETQAEDESSVAAGGDAAADNFEVRSHTVLEVSVEEGGRQLRELHARATRGSRGVAVEAEKGEKDGPAEQDITSVFVHCGVNKRAQGIALETRGFNEATFGAPDEQGYSPTGAPVDEENPDTSHCRVTTVPVAEVLERLGRMGWGREQISESDDAGRFVCNYVYYTSLGLSERLSLSSSPAAATAVAAGGDDGPGCEADHDENDGDSRGRGQQGRHSLFVHVPSFEVMPKDRQLAFLADCLSATAASLGGGAPPPSTEKGNNAANLASGAVSPVGAARPIAVSPFRSSAVPVSPAPAPSVLPVSNGSHPASPSSPPPAVVGKASPSSSIWDMADHSGGPPELPGRGGSDEATHQEECVPVGTDEESGYARDDDDEEQAWETAAEATRRKLTEAGFDELDVDAAMATTGSERTEVNMQFLLDVAPLLPRGAPSDADGLYMREFCNDTGGDVFDRNQRGHPAREGKPRTKSAGSSAAMTGVSPKWVGTISPAGKLPRPGGAFAASPRMVPGSGGGGGSGGGSSDQSSPGPAKGMGGGLLSRFRRHRKVPSTASAVSEATGDGGGAALRDRPSTPNGASWPRASSAIARGVSPEHEYSRQTTGGRLRSQSPTRARAGSGAIGGRGWRHEVYSGWGDPLPAGPDLRLALLVRLDLAMGPGALASQCARAALAAARKAEGGGAANTLAVWREAGEAIVVLGVADAGALDGILTIGAAHHLPITMVREKHAAWVGNISAATCTVAAIGPAPMAQIRAVAGTMPVL